MQKKIKDYEIGKRFYKFLRILFYKLLSKKKFKQLIKWLKEWLEISHMEISLIRSLGIWYGRENLIRLYLFCIIYTIVYTRSLRNFFEKRYGPSYSNLYFRNYLLKICMKRLTLNFSSKVRYSSIFDYMGENKKYWSKEKFFVGCLGFIKNCPNRIEKRLKEESFVTEIVNDSRYCQIVKKYNLSSSDCQ